MKRIIMSIIVVLGMLAFFEPIPTYTVNLNIDDYALELSKIAKEFN